jgi:PAS domain S-box-containing protein
LGLAAVLRQLPVAVVVVEAGSLRIVEFNDRARDMAERQLGQSVPEALEDWWEIFHPDGGPYVLEERPVVRSMISGDQVDGEEYFSVLPDGSRMIVRSNSAPIYDDRGEIVAGVLVMEDVTGQRHMEEQLARHASLVENVEDAVVTADCEWLIRGWNQGAAGMYGWSLEEVLGKPASFVRTDLSDPQRAEIRRELVERGRWRGEATVQRKDGSTVTVEVISVAIRSQKGVSGYLSIHRDITERKRAEDALREAQRGTETILEHIGEWFGALDADWRYTYINRRALERVRKVRGEDVLPADVLGRRIWELFPELVGTTVDQELHRAAREQETVVFETHSPATESWVQVHAYPTTDGGLSIYAVDIAERKQAEKALREAKKRSETILESIGDLFVAMDGKWRITYMNERSVANTGKARGEDLSLDDLLGRTTGSSFPKPLARRSSTSFTELCVSRRRLALRSSVR